MPVSDAAVLVIMVLLVAGFGVVSFVGLPAALAADDRRRRRKRTQDDAIRTIMGRPPPARQ